MIGRMGAERGATRTMAFHTPRRVRSHPHDPFVWRQIAPVGRAVTLGSLQIAVKLKLTKSRNPASLKGSLGIVKI